MKRRTTLSAAEARRLAIAAQQLDRARPDEVTTRHVAATVGHLGLLQIDSVNVLTRAHTMPLFSRLGPYRQELLDGLAYRGRRRRLFEYWAHEASLVPIDMHRLFRWRMEDARRGRGIYNGLAKFGAARQPLIRRLLEEVRDNGPLAASDIKHGSGGKKGWWGWGDTKAGLEWLFWSGALTTARREAAGFTRIYDLPERALPAATLAAPTPDRACAQRELILHALGALGVATSGDLRDYFRLPAADMEPRLSELAEAGAILPVTVEGWDRPAYLDPAARVPRRIDARALLSPFDPLVWRRERAERLFDFHYRIEIYTPAHKRTYGYYCLPFLLGDRLAGRFDLKADRTRSALVVAASHAEPHTDTAPCIDALRDELDQMRRWLGLERLEVAARGGLAKALARAVG